MTIPNLEIFQPRSALQKSALHMISQERWGRGTTYTMVSHCLSSWTSNNDHFQRDTLLSGLLPFHCSTLSLSFSPSPSVCVCLSLSLFTVVFTGFLCYFLGVCFEKHGIQLLSTLACTNCQPKMSVETTAGPFFGPEKMQPKVFASPLCAGTDALSFT